MSLCSNAFDTRAIAGTRGMFASGTGSDAPRVCRGAKPKNNGRGRWRRHQAAGLNILEARRRRCLTPNVSVGQHRCIELEGTSFVCGCMLMVARRGGDVFSEANMRRLCEELETGEVTLEPARSATRCSGAMSSRQPGI